MRNYNNDYLKKLMKTIFDIVCVLGVGLLFAACTGVGVSNVAPKVAPKVNFDADSAYRYTQEQVAFGPRVPGTEAHKRCLEYYVETFKRFGATVEIQQGTETNLYNKPQEVMNVIASYQPMKANRIILCSHWDSRPFADQDADRKQVDKPIDGANDGASSTGVLMEIARQLNLRQPSIGVDIILFDAEDMGTPEHLKLKYMPDSWCLGSQSWGKSDKGKSSEARYAVLLDMIGGPGATFCREHFSQQYASDVVDKIWRMGSRLGYGSYFVNVDGGAITDDHLYINRLTKVPAIDIIHYDAQTLTSFPAYWHTHDDNMSNVDKSSLRAVGETLLAVIYDER